MQTNERRAVGLDGISAVDDMLNAAQGPVLPASVNRPPTGTDIPPTCEHRERAESARRKIARIAIAEIASRVG